MPDVITGQPAQNTSSQVFDPKFLLTGGAAMVAGLASGFNASDVGSQMLGILQSSPDMMVGLFLYEAVKRFIHR